jgi:hypothetical protein
MKPDFKAPMGKGRLKTCWWVNAQLNTPPWLHKKYGKKAKKL